MATKTSESEAGRKPGAAVKVETTQVPKTEMSATKTTSAAAVSSSTINAIVNNTVTKVTSSEKDDEVVDVVSVTSTDAVPVTSLQRPVDTSTKVLPPTGGSNDGAARPAAPITSAAPVVVPNAQNVNTQLSSAQAAVSGAPDSNAAVTSISAATAPSSTSTAPSKDAGLNATDTSTVGSPSAVVSGQFAGVTVASNSAAVVAVPATIVSGADANIAVERNVESADAKEDTTKLSKNDNVTSGSLPIIPSPIIVPTTAGKSSSVIKLDTDSQISVVDKDNSKSNAISFHKGSSSNVNVPIGNDHAERDSKVQEIKGANIGQSCNEFVENEGSNMEETGAKLGQSHAEDGDKGTKESQNKEVTLSGSGKVCREACTVEMDSNESPVDKKSGMDVVEPQRNEAKVSEDAEVLLKPASEEGTKTSPPGEEEKVATSVGSESVPMDIDELKSKNDKNLKTEKLDGNSTEVAVNVAVSKPGTCEKILEVKEPDASISCQSSEPGTTGSSSVKEKSDANLPDNVGTKNGVEVAGKNLQIVDPPTERMNERFSSPAIVSPTKTIGDVIAKLKENDFEAKTTSVPGTATEQTDSALVSGDTRSQGSNVASLTESPAGERRPLAEETQRLLDKLLKKPEGMEVAGTPHKSQNHLAVSTALGLVSPAGISSTAGNVTASILSTSATKIVSPGATSTLSLSSLSTQAATVTSAYQTLPIVSSAADLRTKMPVLAQAQPVQLKVPLPNTAIQGSHVTLSIVGSKTEAGQPMLAQPHVSVPTVQLPLLAPTGSALQMPPLAQVQQQKPVAKMPATTPKPTTSRPVAIAPAPTSTQTSIPIGIAASQISNAAVLKALATGNAFQSGGIQIIQASPGQFIIRSNITSAANQQPSQRAVLLGNTAIMLSKLGAGGQDATDNAQRTMQTLQAGTSLHSILSYLCFVLFVH